MQIFIADLSNIVDKAAFEQSWQGEAASNPNFHVTFRFDGRRIHITIDSDLQTSWQSGSFHRAFTMAVRRVDQDCDIRWS